MSSPRIAIISPNRTVYSETFIRAHIDRLPGVALVLTDGHLPKRNADGEVLLPIALAHRVMRKVKGTAPEDALRDRIAELLRSERIEVVLAEYGPTGAAMLPICTRLGIPLVVHFHGIDAFHHKLLKEHDNYAALFAGAAALVVVSREMEAQLLALGAPRSKVIYNTYGIDPELFAPVNAEENPKRFVGVGRFVDKKAPHLTVLAFARALAHDPELRLELIGDGPLREAVRQLVLALGIDHAVELPGVLPPEEVAAHMGKARAFVQHSVITADNDHEGTPLAVLEAMARALPVVATRHAGIPDVVLHGKCGLLCDERDLDAMAENMLALASDADRAGAMGRVGRSRIEAGHRVKDRVAELHAIIVRAVHG